VEVPVIAELMPIVRHSPHQLGPALGVTSEHEERGANFFLGERVENSGSGVSIGPIIESQSDDSAIGGNSAERRTE
jgi:hypothetical protein